MSEIVFLLEEPSAEAMLKGLVPNLLPDCIPVRYVVFEGKQDLERQLVRRIRGYLVPGARFVVLRDQDADDCVKIKNELQLKCRESGKPGTLVRIACRELESWYLADLAAVVSSGLGDSGLMKLQRKNPYRAPDSLPAPSAQLMRLVPKYQKVSGSRAIGPHLDIDNTRSPSFAVFVAGLRRLANDI